MSFLYLAFVADNSQSNTDEVIAGDSWGGEGGGEGGEEGNIKL